MPARQAPKHLDPDRIVEKALRQQDRYLSEINRYSALKKISGQNKLLKKHLKNHLRNRRKALEKQGRKITNDLISALAWHRVVGILSASSLSTQLICTRMERVKERSKR